ncbi:hypothetical protein [Tumebacillus algifaecis]|uniref:hypothetical protein n=1 Tax=Tumebacillus algifaecis TaxID=1214604 RepID=UPI0012FD55D3|nr:hypothetical protein [Tumebacillus algifaecis]
MENEWAVEGGKECVVCNYGDKLFEIVDNTVGNVDKMGVKEQKWITFCKGEYRLFVEKA